MGTPTMALNADNPNSVAVRGPQRKERWYNCVVCDLSFPASQMRFWHGSPYGVPCRDYLDLEQLADLDDVDRSQQHDTDRVAG